MRILTFGDQKRVSSSFVYILGISDPRVAQPSPIKVGFAKNVEARVASLQTGCPFRIEILARWPYHAMAAAQAKEMQFHKQFADRRLNGEWFDMASADAEKALDAIYDQYIKDMRKLKRGIRQCIDDPSPNSSIAASHGMSRSMLQRRRREFKNHQGGGLVGIDGGT